MSSTRLERCGEDYDSLHCYIQRVGVEIEKVLEGNSKARVKEICPVSTSNNVKRYKIREHPPKTTGYVAKESTKENGCSQANGQVMYMDTIHAVPQLSKDQRSSKERDDEFERRKAAICFGIGDFRPSRENSPKEVLFRNLSERGDIEDVRCNFLPSNSRKDVKKYKRSLSDSIRPVIEKPEYGHYYYSTRKPNWLNEDEQEDVFLRHSYSSITNDTQHFSSLAHSNTNNCDMKSSQHRKEIVNGDNPKHFTEHQTNTRVSESSQHQSFGRCIYCFSKVVGERCHCMYNSGERHRVSVSEDDIKKKQRAELLSQIYEDVKKVTRPVAQKENENVKQSNRTKSKKNHQHQSSSRRKSHDTPVSSQNRQQPDEITLQDNLLKSVQSIIQAPHNQRKEKAKHNSFHEDANQINLHPRSQAVENQSSIVKDINPMVTHPHPNTQPSPPPLPPTNHPRARGYSDSDLDYIQDILEYDNLLLNATESGTSVFELDSDHPENYQHLVNFENNNHPDPRNTLYQKVVKPKGYKFRRLFSSEESLIIPPPPGFGPDDDVQVSISGSVTSTHHDEKGQRSEYSESFRRDYVSELLQDLADDELKQGLGWPNRDRGQTESVQLVDSCTVGTVAVSKDSQENVNGLPNNTGLPQVADVMVTPRKKSPIPATSSITCNLPGEGVTKQPPSSHSSHQRHRHPSGQHPSTNTLDADRQEKSEPQSYKIIGSFLDGHAPCENNTHDTPHDYCLLWADSSRHDLDHGCNTTGLSPFESFTNDLSESSYNILTYSSDSFQADECDVSQYNDYVKDSTSSDHSTDYLKHIFQDGCKENSPSRVNVSCDNGGQHIGFESGATCDIENAETTQSAPLDSHQYFENPLNCGEIPNDAALVCFAGMNARQELLVGNDSLQHRNLRLFRKFEKSTPQSAINSKHDFISPGNVAPVSIRRKFSLEQQREPPIVLEDRNNNHLPVTDDVVNYGSGHLPSGTNGLVEKHEGISTVPSRKDRQRYWLKDTAIQTSLDLNDTVDISGMPASEGFTIKRSSISHLRRLSKDKSPPKTVDDDVTYATVDKSSQRVKTIDKHVDKTPTISSQQGPEIPPRNRLVSRSKSLQTSHHKKAKKGRKNYLEKPSLSGSLKELSHLNIDVSQRLVDGERQYVVDNGSPEMQVIVNALTPVLLRRSRSGRASGKRRIDALCDRSNNSRDVQREEDALAVFQSETDSHRNERKHSIKSQVKVENTSSANTEDQSERKIPIYARIRSHDGTHTKRTVKKKDFYEISKELKKLSRGTEKHPTSKSHSDATQKVTKSVGVSGENNTMKSNDNNAEGSLFLDPKQAHTWHGQGITDLRYRPAPRMGVGMVFIETTKLLAGSEISRQFRNNGNLSISSASSSKSPASTLPPSSHAQTLPIISRTLLDAMHKRYCSHQYARQTSTTLQPFSLLKIDPTSSQGGEPITALRVEPRSPKDHEVTAAPPSSLPSSLSSSASSSSHPVKSSRPTTSKSNRGIISEGESDYRSSTTESVQSSPRQQHLSESDTPKTVPACVKSTNQTSNADNRQKHNNEAGYESSHLVQGNASESKVIPQRPELRESKLQWESNHRVGKATYRRKYSLPELESVIECAHRHELSIVPQQIHQQHHQQHREQQQQQQQHLNQHHHAHVHCQNQLQQLQQGRNQAPCEDLHHPHLHQQQHHHHHHHHHHQQQQQQQQELNQSQCQDHEDTSYDTLAALEHEYHHTSLELQSAFDVSTGSVDSATDERLSHHGKSPAGEYKY